MPRRWSDSEPGLDLYEELERQNIEEDVRDQIENLLKIPAKNRTPIDNQKLFVTHQHIQQRMCPWCAVKISFFEAIPKDSHYKLGHGYAALSCPHCTKGIAYVLPLVGPWLWVRREM